MPCVLGSWSWENIGSHLHSGRVPAVSFRARQQNPLQGTEKESVITKMQFKLIMAIDMRMHTILAPDMPKSKTSSGNRFTDIDILQWKLIL